MPPLEKPSDTPEEQISSLNAGRTRYSDNVSGTPGTDATTQSKAEAADEAWVAQQQRRSRLKASLYQIGMTLAIFAGLGLVVAGLLFLRQRLGGNQGMANIPVINSLSLTNGAGKGSSAATNPSQLAINGDVRINGILSLTPQAISNLAGNLSSKVDLQPSFPGVAQNGNIIVSGIVSASSFQGGGAGLSSLNASALASGTVSNDRLDPSVTRLGQTIPLSSLQTSVIASINNIVSNGGNVDIISGSGITVITDPVTKTITLNSTSGGDITGVMAGTGLLGGGLSGDVTLDIDTGLVTVQGNTFNLPGKLVQLDGAGNLPALNGSALTNLNATSLSSGTLADARLSAGVTLQGNAFNGVNQLVQLNGAGELPVLSALNLTNLNASQILTGTVSDARLSSNVTFAGNTFNLPGKLVQLDGAGNLPALNGSAVTGLNATNIASGTVADARLSANVALLSANQTFSGNVSFAQPLSVNTIQPSSTMTIGALDQTLVLQGDLSTKLTAHSGANSVSLGFTGAPTGTIQYSLDASAPAGSYQLCTTIGNCAGSGGGVTTVGGSTNKLAKFVGAQAVADSSITDTGSLVTVGAATLFKPSADSISAMQVQNAAGSATALAVNTTSNRVAVGQATAGYTLDVAGDINSSTGLRVAGNLVCDATGCAASSGSGFYVRNGTTLQTDTNFNIESTSTAAVVGVVKGKAGQIADLFQAKNGSGSVVAAIDKDGNINTAGQLRVNGAQISSSNLSNDSNLAKLNASQAFTGANTFTGATKIQPAADSTSAFQVQNSAGTSNLLVADTVNTRLGVGTATPGYTVDVNGDVNIANGGSYRINGVSICGPSSTCAPSAGSNNYVQNGLIKQANTNFNIQTISSGSVVGILQGASGQTADILQARDSSNAVLAKITASGQIFQGANQVCDASNNCNYALGSGSGSYIQNGVGTQVANFNIKSASASSVGAVIQGAVGQTADLFQAKDGSGATVAGIGATGNVLFKNSTNSTSALQVQNAAGTTILNIDNTVPVPTTWTTGNSFSGNRYYPSAVTYNNYLYVIGGDPSNSVQYAPVNPSTGATTATFSTATNLTNGIAAGGAFASNGYMFVIGGRTGFNSSSATGQVISAPINGNGSLGAWTTLTSIATPRANFGLTVYNGYVYISGGYNSSGTNLNDVQYAKINNDGTLGAWTSATSLTNARYGHASVAINGYLYILGGSGASTYNDVQYAPINGNGSIGTWSTTASFVTPRYIHAAVTNGGQIYLMGGLNASSVRLSDMQYATPNTDGTIPTWANTTNLYDARYGFGAAVGSGFLYVAGGYNGSVVSDVRIFSLGGATTSRLTLNGASVTNGTATFQNTADSTTAFQIQNAAGTNLMTADTVNARIGIGTTPSYTLDVASTVSSTNTTGARVVLSNASTGSQNDYGLYVDNQHSSDNGTHYGIYGQAVSATNTGTSIGVYGKGLAGLVSYGVYGEGNANGTANRTQYGVYGKSGVAASSNSLNYGGYFELQSAITASAYNASSAALVANVASGSTSSDWILNLRNNNVNKFVVNGNGGTGINTTSLGTAGLLAVNAPTTIDNTATVLFATSAAGNKGLVIQGAAGQVADLLQAQDSTGTTLSAMNSAGSLAINADSTALAANTRLRVNNGSLVANGASSGWQINGITNGTQLFTSESRAYGSPSSMALSGDINGYTINTIGAWGTIGSFSLARGCCTRSIIGNRSVGVSSGGSSDQISGGQGIATFEIAGTAGNSAGRGLYGEVNTGQLGAAVSRTGYGVQGVANSDVGSIAYGGHFRANGAGINTALQAEAGTATTKGLVVKGFASQAADLLQIQDSAAVNMLSVGATGNVLFKNTANSTTAFQVQDASGANLLIADTVNKRICISTCASMSQSIKLESDGVTFGNGSGNVTAKITQQGNGPLLIGAGSSGNFNGVSIAGAGVGASLTVRGSAITPTDILRIQASSGNDVLNINTTGAVLAKNSANSTAAFQIQNASGARVLNVNTNVNPSPNAWLATTSLPATRESHGSVAYNGYLYAVGGYSGGILGDVQFAPINNNSTIGSWSATSGLSARYSHQTVAYNGYMYALGGYNGGSLSSVQYSAIGSNGTLGSWSNTTGLTVSRYALSAAAYNGYMYALGGVNGTTPQSGVQYAPINANGTLGSWTNTTAMPTTRSGAATVIANGYIYMVGGTGDPTSVIYAPINSDGSLGVWTSTTALPSARQSVSAVVNNNSLYVMGGYDTSNNTTNSVVSIPLNMDGTLGTSWTIRPNISSARAYAGSAAYKGTIYLTGGNGTYNSTQPKSDVQYLPLGTFLYDNSITLNGLLSNTGPAQFRNDTDSTTAFAIQNATATSIFQVDTQNSRVGVGNASPGNLLSVGALTTADSDGQLAVGTGGTSNKGIIIQGVSGQTADLLQAQDSTGAVLAKIDNAGNLTVKSITLAGHIISGGGTPTIAANAGAGASPTITVSGTDTSGTITLTTGTSVAPSADVLTLTFATAFAQAPNVVFSPASAGAATLSGNSAVFVTAGTGSFKFSVGSAGLVDSTQYKWTYHVIQ